jgi:hypothetical protein
MDAAGRIEQVPVVAGVDVEHMECRDGQHVAILVNQLRGHAVIDAGLLAGQEAPHFQAAILELRQIEPDLAGIRDQK